MTSHNEPQLSEELAAAIVLWEHLAAFAWEQALTLGRGVVICRSEDMFAAQRQLRADQPVQLQLGYVPLLDVPSGDDFLQIIASYDVKRQIVLLVGKPGRDGADDDEQLVVLEAGEGGRPLPEDCFHRMQQPST